MIFVSLASLVASGRGVEQQLNPADFLPEMNQPVEPIDIIGNIYYVGTNAVSSFLIVTSQGHILIDSMFNQSVPLIRQSVNKLGFRRNAAPGRDSYVRNFEFGWQGGQPDGRWGLLTCR